MDKEIVVENNSKKKLYCCLFIPLILISGCLGSMFLFANYKPFTMDGISMQPTLCNSDLVITTKDSKYERGDIIVFAHDKISSYSKRIVGIGGDKIKIKDEKVILNGIILKESYLQESIKTRTDISDEIKEDEEYLVPDGSYFVLGDNRSNSFDSRAFLAVNPKSNKIEGKVKYVKSKNTGFRSFDKNKAEIIDNCKN